MKCCKITSHGPCGNQAVDGSHFCKRHTNQEDQVAVYRLSDPNLSDSVDHHAKAALSDLTQQLVLLRAIIERRLNMAGDDVASQISAMNFAATQVANLVKSTEIVVKLTKESGALLEATAVQAWVDRVVGVVREELSDLEDYAERVDRILEKLSDE